MSIFTRSDILNINAAVAEQFAAGMAEVVSLTVVHSTPRVNLFAGVVADSTTGTVSFVPFVAKTGALLPGYSKSTIVALHTDKADPTLATAATNAVALIGTDPGNQASAPLGVIPADVGATI